MEQDKIRPWSRSKLGGGRRSRSKPCERNALVPRPPPLRTLSPCATELLRPPPSSITTATSTVASITLHHRHSPSTPLQPAPAPWPSLRLTVARQQPNLPAQPTLPAALQWLAPPVALLFACGVIGDACRQPGHLCAMRAADPSSPSLLPAREPGHSPRRTCIPMHDRACELQRTLTHTH